MLGILLFLGHLESCVSAWHYLARIVKLACKQLAVLALAQLSRESALLLTYPGHFFQAGLAAELLTSCPIHNCHIARERAVPDSGDTQL